MRLEKVDYVIVDLETDEVLVNSGSQDSVEFWAKQMSKLGTRPIEVRQRTWYTYDTKLKVDVGEGVTI